MHGCRSRRSGVLSGLTFALAVGATVPATLLLPACETPTEEVGNPDSVFSSRVRRVASWLTGSFSSAEQAARDERFRNIDLHAARIWPDREDAIWLYVEQAVSTAPDRPYRQRVYRISEAPSGEVASAVYELPGEPLAWTGAWRTPARFDDLDPAELVERVGCTVYLQRDARGRFVGGTRGRGCTSDWGDAAYATSEVSLGALGLTSLDRGYDAGGAQVWGSEHGPYEFTRIDAVSDARGTQIPEGDNDSPFDFER